MANSPENKNLATRRELADHFSIHPMTVVKWEQKGMPVAKKGGPGRPSLYDVDEVTAWKAARDESADEENAGGPLDPIQERAKKEKFQALLAEQTFLTRQKLLLPADDVAKTWRAEIAAVRQLILSSYATHSDRVYRASKLDGVAGVEREMKALAYEVLRELAREDRPLPDPDAPTPVVEPVKAKRPAKRKRAA